MAPKKKVEKTYRIVGLQTENIKRVRAISLDPDGNVINITGENGNGKTSLLDSIWIALQGAKVIEGNPIRGGEKQGQVSIDLGEITLIRSFKMKEDGSFSSDLSVETAEGFKAQKPQSILDAMIGKLTFDPLEFVNLKAEKQFEQLKSFVPDFDFVANSLARQAVYDKRTDVNRRIRDLKGELANIVVDEDVPDSEVSISDLMSEMEEIGKHNSDIRQRELRREQADADARRHRKDAATIDLRIDALMEEMEALKKQRDQNLENAESIEKRIKDAGELPELKSADEIRLKIREAEDLNARVRTKSAVAAQRASLEAMDAETKAFTASIDAIDKEKDEAIANSNIPVKGLTFSDGIVMLNGFPFSDASKAEQIRACVQLAAASNPKLRIAFIRDGSLLDKKSMKLIAELADEMNIQIWMETVERETPGAVVIVDGSVERIVGE